MNFLKKLFGCFLSGLLTLLPLVLTCAIVAWCVQLLNGYIGPGTVVGKWLASLGYTAVGERFYPYLVGWVVVLGGIFLFGVLLQIGMAHFWKSQVDHLLARVPLLGQVYATLCKFTSMASKDGDSEMKDMSPVYCDLGGTLLLALRSQGKNFTVDGREYAIVVVPTAPVPFGGAMLLVPVEQVRPAEISLDALMNFYVTMGVSAETKSTETKEETENT
ncbi:MAG: DUF502 domain-containing protein [Planctomycetia bacterium]|nr:DUF502 domain-containing protein [Planctomycetia bacterium]